MDPIIELLLHAMDEAFDHRSWHGTNLRGSIRGLSAAEAAWRPGPRRHNAWEIVVHAAYWKYAARRRLLREKRGSFPLKGSNWFERPASRTSQLAQWKSDVALLVATHHSLRDAVARLAPGDLRRTSAAGDTSIRALVSGMIAHDLYHAGQIQLLKRLQNRSR